MLNKCKSCWGMLRLIPVNSGQLPVLVLCSSPVISSHLQSQPHRRTQASTPAVQLSVKIPCQPMPKTLRLPFYPTEQAKTGCIRLEVTGSLSYARWNFYQVIETFSWNSEQVSCVSLNQNQDESTFNLVQTIPFRCLPCRICTHTDKIS